MLNKVLIGAAAAVWLAACAGNPSTTGTAAPKMATTAGCVANTGSRIPPGPNDCAAVGHTLSQDDMRRTGSTDVAGALPLLDPRVSVKQ